MDPEERRKDKRHTAPSKTLAAWKAPGQGAVSRVQNIGLGGLYLAASAPPAAGTSIDLVLSLPVGEVRARAVVCRSTPGKGMGVQFVLMRGEDRAKLNRFLLNLTERHQKPATGPVPLAQAPPPPTSPTDQAFNQELTRILESLHHGTYYQLLGVTSVSPSADVKRNYYTLAKKFHPDLHMDKKHLAGSLKVVMEKITAAYQTLRDEQQRKAYDQKLASAGAFKLERSKTESQETVEECMGRAQECLRARNLAGSITWLRKCVLLTPESGKHHALLARSLSAVRAYKDEAILHFEKAIELDPWNTDAYFYLGEVYESLKLPWRAHPLYAKILEIDPDHRKAFQKLHPISSHSVVSDHAGRR
jgi:tetratricopeptide (TPR) repeat protein